MKKFLLTICALSSFFIVGALFILPYGLGFIAQNKYTQVLDVFSKSSAMQMTLLDYQRGWFSSEATIKVTPQSKSGIITEPFMIKQRIEHGPIFSLASGKGGESLLLGQGLIISHIESTFGAIDILNWIKLDGTLWGNVHAPVLHFVDAHAEQDVTVHNFSGVFKLPANLRQFSAHFGVSQIAVKTNKFEQHIDQINLYYHLQKSESGLFLGRRALTVGSMVLDTPVYPSKLAFNGFNIRAYDTEQNHRTNHEIDIGLQQISINHGNYGPQEMVLAINQLDTATLLTLRKELNKLRRGDALSEQAVAKYQQLFVALLSKGLEIHIKKLQIVTPWGNPSLVADMILPAQPADDDLKRLLRAANMNVAANTPATFLVRALEKFYTLTQSAHPTTPNIDNSVIAQQQVSDWVSKKWLLPKDNGYQINILYQNQYATINGQPLNTPANVQNSVVSNLSTKNMCQNAQRLS